MSYPGAAHSVTLYDVLRRIDEDLADNVRRLGCPACGSPLDSAPWQRHPRGVPSLRDKVWWRLGLCCRKEGCRRRVLPPSVLFLGRKVYFNAVILVSVVSRERRLVGATADALCKWFGMSRATLKRWISFFRYDFPESRVWKVLRGRVSAAVKSVRVADTLLGQFEGVHGTGEAALKACLTAFALAAIQAS
jgi:hypothetical protein